ncbi:MULTISPECIES: glycosyltransferase [Enterococcus]|uniref:Glycosyltransferase n=1 Tax=Candidatus Enterococcus murrayae TaxID=2815321 RepID=A0ABS3HKP9_9ENTE|nr:glycosyltransferase [Enterococcus sp. MJM16]MBO0454030.1 glycosyltransferase [Enterococcus sp. MJM16]
MNICIVGPSFGYGGANIVAANVGKKLSENNKVYFVGFKSDANYTNIPEDQMYYIGNEKNRFFKLFVKAKKASELLLKKEITLSKYYKDEIDNLCRIVNQNSIDLVILNSFVSSTIFCVELKKRLNIPVISWMHESVEHSFNDLAKNYPTAFEQALVRSDEIVCLTRNDSKKFLTLNKKTKVIYNPVNIDKKKISQLEDKVISFTTRLDIQIKGLDYLVDIAQKLPDDWHVRVAGQGREDQIKDFKSLLETKDKKNKIEFVGSLSGKELEEHYRKSSIFLSTSRVEALPLVLIEALFFGLPIVSFEHSGAVEILDSGKFGCLVKKYDLEEMTEKLNKLIQNRDLREEFQKKSLERSESFDTSHILNQWQSLIANIIQNGGEEVD